MSGCSNQKKINYVYIGKNIKFNLIDSPAFNKQIELNQRLIAEYQNQKYSLNLFTKISAKTINIWGFTVMGNRLFSLEYKNKKLIFQGSKFLIINKNTQLQYMLADLELVYLNKSIINQNLSKNATLQETETDQQLKRILYVDQKPIIEILYSTKNPWNSKIQYQHLERKYNYTIENI